MNLRREEVRRQAENAGSYEKEKEPGKSGCMMKSGVVVEVRL